MKIDEDGFIEFGDGKGSFHFINDWEQLFGKWNWYTFNVVQFYFEKDTMIGESYVFSIVLLGLGFEIRYTPYIKEEFTEQLDKIEELKQ